MLSVTTQTQLCNKPFCNLLYTVTVDGCRNSAVRAMVVCLVEYPGVRLCAAYTPCTVSHTRCASRFEQVLLSSSTVSRQLLSVYLQQQQDRLYILSLFPSSRHRHLLSKKIMTSFGLLPSRDCTRIAQHLVPRGWSAGGYAGTTYSPKREQVKDY